MTDRVAELTAQARALPPEERARLAQALLASLDPRVSDVETAWHDELRRRIDEVEHHAVVLVSESDAYSQLDAALKR